MRNKPASQKEKQDKPVLTRQKNRKFHSPEHAAQGMEFIFFLKSQAWIASQQEKQT